MTSWLVPSNLAADSSLRSGHQTLLLELSMEARLPIVTPYHQVGHKCARSSTLRKSHTNQHGKDQGFSMEMLEDIGGVV